MEDPNKINSKEFWKQEIRKHWMTFAFCIAAIVLSAIGALLVLIWHVLTSPIGLQGTATLNQWSLNWIVVFCIVLILWEALFVGIPVGLFFGLGGYLWWRRLPLEEKNQFKAHQKKEEKTKHGRNAGGAVGFFLFIAYCIYIAIDGNYFAEFGSQPYSYWIFSYLLTIGWLLIIFGIPAVVILCVLYFVKWR